MEGRASVPQNRPGLVYRSISARTGESFGFEASGVGIEIQIYRKDTVVRRVYTNTQSRRRNGAKRGTITEFSRKSRQRLSFAARNVEPLPYFVTLTYPAEFPTDGKVVKRHFKAFREWLRRRGVKFFWWIEFQKRGAPHFHLSTDTWIHHEALAAAWYKIVGSGDPKHLRAGTRIEAFRNPDGFAAYASKYAAKMEQKEVPEVYRDVGRFWGYSKAIKPKSKPILSGSMVSMITALRVLRNLYNARRRSWGCRPFRDSGSYSFILWGGGYLPPPPPCKSRRDSGI